MKRTLGGPLPKCSLGAAVPLVYSGAMSNAELLSRITVDQTHGTAGGMKFIVDAQLPRRLARKLIAAGHVAVHTLE